MKKQKPEEIVDVFVTHRMFDRYEKEKYKYTFINVVGAAFYFTSVVALLSQKEIEIYSVFFLL